MFCGCPVSSLRRVSSLRLPYPRCRRSTRRPEGHSQSASPKLILLNVRTVTGDDANGVVVRRVGRRPKLVRMPNAASRTDRTARRERPPTAIKGDEAHDSLDSFCPTVLRDPRRPLRPAVRRESLQCMSTGRSLGWLVCVLPTRWWTAAGHRSGDDTEQSGRRPLLGQRDYHHLPGWRARARPRADA